MLKEERQFDCRFNDATDISDWRLCIGCGACVSACPENRLEMVDVLDDGLRPILKPSDNASGCDQCTVCVSACPGIDISHSTDSDNLPKIQQLAKSWGPILEVWEGHATDHGVHFEGSSGGLASALAVYCIEKGGMHGVAHVGNDPEVGYRNKSVFSRTRAEILQGIRSRYAPASPCDNLQSIAEQSGPSAFVGKPCDVKGLRKVAHIRPDVARNVGVAIGIFCAGTPSTQGTPPCQDSCRVY